MGKQRVRCPRDDRIARLPAMIHLLSCTAWIMAILSCHVSMVPPPTKSVTVRKLPGLAQSAGDGEVSDVATAEVGTAGILATELREVVHGTRCGLERGARTRLEALL